MASRAGNRESGRAPRRQAVRWLRVAAIAVGGVAFVAGWITAGWVVGLDRIVRSRFEGQRFQVPSRVYSAPMILYPGLDWKLVDLDATLRRLGYRKARATDSMP